MISPSDHLEFIQRHIQRYTTVYPTPTTGCIDFDCCNIRCNVCPYATEYAGCDATATLQSLEYSSAIISLFPELPI